LYPPQSSSDFGIKKFATLGGRRIALLGEISHPSLSCNNWTIAPLAFLATKKARTGASIDENDSDDDERA